MKKIYKIMSIIAIVLMIACISTNVFAGIDMNNIKAGDTSADSQMEKIGSTIISYITNAAMVVAVIMIAVLGIKYMLGSSEEKSEYKKSMLPLLIGACLVFGAAAIAKVVVSLAGTFTA